MSFEYLGLAGLSLALVVTFLFKYRKHYRRREILKLVGASRMVRASHSNTSQIATVR